MNSTLHRRRRRREGFSLVEVTLALGIVVFCLSALMGLLWVGLTGNQASSSQGAANSILSAVVSDLRATPPATPPGSASATSLLYKITIPANPVTSAAAPIKFYFNPDGEALTSLQPDSSYLLSVTFLANATGTGTTSRSATFVDLKVTWPAAASPANALGAVETFVALDRN